MKTFLQGNLSPFSLLVMLKLATLFPIWFKQIITKDAYQNGKKKNKKKNSRTVASATDETKLCVVTVVKFRLRRRPGGEVIF